MRALAAKIYEVAIGIRSYLYNKNIFSSLELPVPVVSVGNLTVGGTGKSPIVNFLVEELLRLQRTPLVLSRGYKRRATKPVYIKPGNLPIHVDEVGDEPFLLKKKYPHCGLLVSKNRGVVALENWKDVAGDIVLLDDAFQYWELKRDIDIITIDLSKELWPDLLPIGSARENPRALARASIIVFTHGNEVDSPAVEKKILAIVKFISENRSKQAESWKRNSADGRASLFFLTGYKIQSIFSADGCEISTDDISGKKVILASGIGNPNSFSKLIMKMNCIIVDHKIFPDHHWCSPTDIEKLIQRSKDVNPKFPVILITEKDFVRWQSIIPKAYRKNFFYPTIEVDFLERNFPSLPLSAKSELVLAIHGLKI